MPTSPVLLEDGSSHWKLHASLQRHDDVQQQHGDHGWTEPTFTAPRVRSQLPFFNAFEFLDEPKSTEFSRWRVRQHRRRRLLTKLPQSLPKPIPH